MDPKRGVDSPVEMVRTVIADFNDDCFVPLAVVNILNALADLILQLLQLSVRGRGFRLRLGLFVLIGGLVVSALSRANPFGINKANRHQGTVLIQLNCITSEVFFGVIHFYDCSLFPEH